MAVRIEWNATKASLNLRKHGVSFVEASSVFDDPLSLTIRDPIHAVDDVRFATIGVSRSGRTLVVVHADRGDNIRIISARAAGRRERQQYEEE